ncbi:hypothetical protein QBC34DRAFT_473309 [Podospora aff. communis PSN243]|uniref:HNH domain-containing protein n=1 Tax=Podospora aff. communis PSN243 TaxID=3040156 RepID=A0AAV9G9Z8_9PEZI|nr:hypothetical protein QBC34DRAFT_473309 [Podospora aff. communis PSN243]
MSTDILDEEISNYETFRDTLSAVLIQRLSQVPAKATKSKSSRRSRQKQHPRRPPAEPPTTPTPEADTALPSDADDLSDFITYIATSIFTALPSPFRTLSHHTWSTTPSLQSAYSLPLTAETTTPLLNALDPSIPDSLLVYSIINSTSTTPLPADISPSTPLISLPDLLAPILTTYLTTITAPPPPPASTKATTTACEICQRDWINLSYHHLIPRFVHAKVVKRGWHRADELQNVAWLCGACHQFVHRFANHEDLARKYYTVELLLAEEEVVRWAEWVGRLRWKGLGVRRTKGP